MKDFNAPATADYRRSLEIDAFLPMRLAVRTGRSYRVDSPITAGFAAGAHVIVRNINPTGTTKLPRGLKVL